MRKKDLFQVDLIKYYLIVYKTATPKFFQKIKLCLFNMGLHCIAVYRFGQFALHLYAKNKIIGFPFRFTYVVLNYLVQLIYQVELHSRCKIGPGFHISHVGNIHIGVDGIGKNCTITHNITIGHGFELERLEFPTIGKNVFIGTGSVIAGGIKIGDNVTISSGSILTRDIPDGCLVGGNPARVILREYNNEWMRMIGEKISSIADTEMRHITES